MPLVSIPILDTEYRFRKLTFREEFALIFPRGIDPCRVVLTAALVEVFRVGYTPFPVSDSATAGELLRPIPPPVLQRVWIAYKAGLEENRFFSTKRLYRAPGVKAYNQRVRVEESAEDAAMEPGLNAIRKQFGPQEAADLDKVQKAILKDARDRNILIRAREDSDV
jgi:hypothetical protein